MILIKNKHFGFFCFVFDISKTLPKMMTNFWRAPVSTVEVKSKKNVYSQLIHLCSHTNLDGIPTGRNPRHFINKKMGFFWKYQDFKDKGQFISVTLRGAIGGKTVKTIKTTVLPWFCKTNAATTAVARRCVIVVLPRQGSSAAPVAPWL